MWIQFCANWKNLKRHDLFASLKKLKHEFNFLLAQRSPKIMEIIDSSLKRLQNYELEPAHYGLKVSDPKILNFPPESPS